MTAPPELALFFGRFHPLVVHLPVALILLLAGLEFLSRFPKFRHANANAGIILAINVPAALLAALFGWLLSLEGGYQDQVLKWHKWTGLATAAICVLAALLYRLDLKKPYRRSLFCGVILLSVSAHFGGSLTHGSDYLVRYAPGPIRALFANPPQPLAPETQGAGGAKPLQVFSAAIQPVFHQNCVSCHGPEKSKGGLRLDSLEAAIKGGENGPGIVPGKVAESFVLKRMRLPLSDEDHMPPEGKPQPGAADLALIEWWIHNGAPLALDSQSPILNSSIPAVVAQTLQARMGLTLTPPKPIAPQPLAQVLPVALKLGEDLNVSLSPIAAGEPWLQCNASLAGTNFGAAELARLAAVGLNLRWLDLGGTGLRDADLALLAQMPNLTRLHLERTAITDSALGHVSKLASLEYLNLHHTEVTDAGLEALRPLANLRQLYLWETKVSPAAVELLTKTLAHEEQLAQWREEIELLQAKVRQAKVVVDLGSRVPPPSPPTNSLVNATCPVSGKPVDASKTLVQDGKTVAFCCDDCKTKFEQDPKAYLPKLPPLLPKEPASETSK